MTAGKFEPWVNPHNVLVESQPVTLYRWECFTCGHVEDGYTSLRHCEEVADGHATNSPRPSDAA